MRLRKQFIQIQLISFAVLLLTSLFFATLTFRDESANPTGWFGPFKSAVISFAAILGCGALPVVLILAPAYDFLFRHGKDGLVSSLALGGAFGIPWLAHSSKLAILAGVVGAAVSVITHFVSKFWLKPNSRFDTDATRGST